MTDLADRTERGPSSPDGSGRMPIDWVVFGVAAALALAFLIWGMVNPVRLGEVTGDSMSWLTDSLGWLFVLTSCGFVLFSAYLAFTRYGNISLGPDDSLAGVLHLLLGLDDVRHRHGHRADVLWRGGATVAPQRPSARARRTRHARNVATRDGVHLLPLGLPPLVDVRGDRARDRLLRLPQGPRQPRSRPRSGPLLGDRASQGPGKAIDVVAIFATLFGSATSLGLGALQITGGTRRRLRQGRRQQGPRRRCDCGPHRCFVLSAVSGVDKGIKWLSNANAGGGPAGALPVRRRSDRLHPRHLHRVARRLPHPAAGHEFPHRGLRLGRRAPG